MKLIFVTSCKELTDEKISVIQENTLNSWKWLNCEKEIYVFNRTESIRNLCESLSINLVTDYESSEYSDLPTWRTMRNYASDISNQNDVIIWSNSDIIFDDSLVDTINSVYTKNSSNDIILTGKRYNWGDYHKISNKENIKELVLVPNGDNYEIDYFVYRKNNFSNLPKFYIARMRFDNFLLNHSINNVDYTVDATETIRAIHHQHKYGNNLLEPWSSLLENNDIKNELNENYLNCNSMSNIMECKYLTKNINNVIEIVKK